MQFGGEPQVAPRRHAEADAPAQAVRQLDSVRLAADDETAESGQLDALVDLLAEDRIERKVRLAGSDSFLVVFRGRQLDQSPNAEGERILPPLRRKVHLAANPDVAELVARPPVADERIVVDDATTLAVGRTEVQGPRIAVDAPHRVDRREQLGAIAESDTERDRPIRHVGEAFVVVEVRTIQTERPTTCWEDLAGRHEPQPRITHVGGGGRPCLCRRHQARVLGGWLRTTLRRCRRLLASSPRWWRRLRRRRRSHQRHNNRRRYPFPHTHTPPSLTPLLPAEFLRSEERRVGERCSVTWASS